MRYHIITGLIGAVAFMGGLLLAEPGQGDFIIEYNYECQEDMPCWDWRTMGNGCHGIDDNGTIECYRDGSYFIMEGLT